METLLVRLKPFDPRRGHVLRRYTYARHQVPRGARLVPRREAGRRVPARHRARCASEHSPPAFDVCTDGEAKALDAGEKEARRSEAQAPPTTSRSCPRGRASSVTTEDLPKSTATPRRPAAKDDDKDAQARQARAGVTCTPRSPTCAPKA
jgi:hypothetical protein